jgi:hypothetical protein
MRAACSWWCGSGIGSPGLLRITAAPLMAKRLVYISTRELRRRLLRHDLSRYNSEHARGYVRRQASA